MTCGCPVICSDLPGHSSIVNKDCGIICQKEMSKYSDRRLFICLRVAEYERKRKKIYQKIAHGIKLVSKSRRFI